MTAIPKKRPPKASRREKSTKEKTLESGSRFLPSVSRKQLVRSIREEKDPVARDRMLACLHRKEGWSIRRICKIMVRPYSTMRDWLWRMQEGGIRCRHDKERGRRKCKIPKEVFRAVRRWVKKEPSDFKFESGSWQLNLLLEMIRERFGAGMQRAHASQVVAQKQALVEKIQARTVQDSLQKRANGVQAKGRRAGVPDARGRIRRVYRRRGCNPDAAEPKLWLEAHGWTGDEQDHVFNKIDPDVWRNVRRPTHHQGSRLCKLGDVPRIPRRDPPGSSEILHGAGQRLLPQVKNDSKVRGICRRRHHT